VNRKWIEEIPTLAVEVLSPTDRPGKVNQKVADYLASGVQMIWVIDPEECNVAVYRPSATLVTLNKSREIDGGEILPGFRCLVAAFFYSTGDQSA
jgi:Uma2 family endonuclease